jgi:beta-lactamase regulating signal transducer with metallopeptidase domain
MGEIWATMAGYTVDLLLRDSACAAIVCVLVVVICGVLRGRTPALRLALWSLVFVRLVLPPNLSHPLAIGELLPGIASLIGDHEVLEGGDGGGVLAALRPLGTAVQAGDSARSVPGWVKWLFVAWAVGVVAAAFGHARRLRRVRRLLARSETCGGGEICELMQQWRIRLRIRRPVRLVTADSEVMPFTAGILRPVVFVSRGVLGDRRLLEPALAHELAHVACWHAFWLALQHAVQIVYWFHPAVWLAGSRVAHERERLCDALVLNHRAFSAPQYARSLLLASRLRAPDGPVFELTFRSRRFSMRIRDVLEPSNHRPPKRLAAAVCAAGLALVVLPMAGGASSTSSGDSRDMQHGESAVELDNPLPEGQVSWRWGDARDPWSGEPVFHQGIDLAAPAGTPIVAPAPGTVAVATVEYEPSPTSGTVAILDHGGGVTTFYAHLGSLVVAAGDRVRTGQVIAEVGSTGKSTGPHLHFEVRRDGEPQDPTRFVEGWE